MSTDLLNNDLEFKELYRMLDREDLNENQVSFLAVDILVGDISIDYYLNLKQKVSSNRVSRNAQRVIDHASDLINI